MYNYKSPKLHLTVFIVVLLIIGISFGISFMSGKYRIIYEQRRQILEQRIKLIERASKIINLAPQMSNYQSYLQFQADLARKYSRCLRVPTQSCIKPDDLKIVLEVSNKRSDLDAEFSSTLQLVAMYFGEKTKAATHKLSQQKPWWKREESGARELIKAMNEEIDYFGTSSRTGHMGWLSKLFAILDWSAFASLAALLTAFATVITILEMRRTRIQSILPQLILLPPRYRYELRWIPLESLQIIIRPELADDEKNRYSTRLPVFLLKNIGTAAARDISIRWKIEAGNVFEIVRNSEILKKYQPTVNGEIIWLSSGSNTMSNSCGVPCQSEQISDIPFSIASPGSDWTDPVEIPDRIINNYLFKLVSFARPLDIAKIDCPSIYIEIDYFDLDGRLQSTHFIVESHLMFLPDKVSSAKNDVKATFYNQDNMRGTLRFNVKPAKKDKRNIISRFKIASFFIGKREIN